MSVRDPRILIRILDDLIQEIGRCTETVRNTLQKASYTQRCAQEQIERGLHSANVFKDWVECDRENVQDADAEVANLLSKCSEAEQVSHETLDEVEEVFHYAQVTLQQWEQELNKALAWLERAKVRLERAIQEENAAQRNWESAQDEMKQAEIRLRRCLNDTERRNCNREEKAYELARLNVHQALERWKAAEIEVSLAKEEVAQAQARVNCCRQAVDYAKQAVAQAQLAREHADQAVNSAERSLEEAEASNRFMVSAQTKVTEETDLTEQMILAVHQAQTFTSEAQIHYQNSEYAAESAQRLATLGCQELEYRVQQLYLLNQTSGDFVKSRHPLFSVPGTDQVVYAQPLPIATPTLPGAGHLDVNPLVETKFINEFAKSLDYKINYGSLDKIGDSGQIRAYFPDGQDSNCFINFEITQNGRVKIKDTWVDANFRRKGIATLLVKTIESYLQDGDELYFEENQSPDFWNKMGFQKRNYRGKNEFYKRVSNSQSNPNSPEFE